MISFEAFYRNEYAGILGIALALAKDTSEAEDLVQEAFISAHRRWDRVSQYDSPRRLGDSTPPQTTPTTPTTVATTMGTEPEPPCSSGDVPQPSEAPGLPAAVATTRDAIATAAASCDFGALRTLTGDNFTTSFGGGGAENLRLWEEDGDGRMGTLLHLLDMTHGTNELAYGGEIYVWPAAATYDSWESISEKELDELSTIYSEGELDQMATVGQYLGWRTGIDENGEWLYFVAGD